MERGQDNGGPAHDNVPTRAAMIEDEPASDFYASLVGVKASPGSRKRRRILPPQRQPNSKHGPSDNTHGVNHQSRSEVPAASLPIVDAEVDDTTTSERSDHQESPGPALKSEMAHTLHRAFANPPTNQTSLSLDKSNKGYAMLSAMGWSEESGGLGRSRQGEMVPVKTTLKMDKRGLGSRSAKGGERSAQGTVEARITHRHDDIEAAAGRDNNSGSRLISGETKAERKKRKKQEADKASREDRRVRMMLRSDIPPEYEELYMRLHR